MASRRNPAKPVTKPWGCLALTGLVTGLFFIGIIVVALFDPTAPLSVYPIALILTALAAGGGWAAWRRLVFNRRSGHFFELVVNQKHDAVDIIASLLNRQDRDVVMQEIQASINAGHLAGYALDPRERRIRRAEAMDRVAMIGRNGGFKCSGCGAMNRIEPGSGPAACSYCGRPAID